VALARGTARKAGACARWRFRIVSSEAVVSDSCRGNKPEVARETGTLAAQPPKCAAILDAGRRVNNGSDRLHGQGRALLFVSMLTKLAKRHNTL
jgi:hypothetical protein